MTTPLVAPAGATTQPPSTTPPVPLSLRLVSAGGAAAWAIVFIFAWAHVWNRCAEIARGEGLSVDQFCSADASTTNAESIALGFIGLCAAVIPAVLFTTSRSQLFAALVALCSGSIAVIRPDGGPAGPTRVAAVVALAAFSVLVVVYGKLHQVAQNRAPADDKRTARLGTVGALMALLGTTLVIVVVANV